MDLVGVNQGSDGVVVNQGSEEEVVNQEYDEVFEQSFNYFLTCEIKYTKQGDKQIDAWEEKLTDLIDLFRQKTALTKINISGKQIANRDRLALLVEAILTKPSIEEVDFSSNNFCGKVNLENIAKLIPQVKYLNLANNPIGNSGFRSFVETATAAYHEQRARLGGRADPKHSTVLVHVTISEFLTADKVWDISKEYFPDVTRNGNKIIAKFDDVLIIEATPEVTRERNIEYEEVDNSSEDEVDENEGN